MDSRCTVIVAVLFLTGWNEAAGANQAPHLKETYVFTVPENLPAGTHAGRVTALDPDGPQELAFSVADIATNALISLSAPVGNSVTGRSVDMVLKKSLDREVQSSYKLQLSVTDGTNTVPFTVTMFVSDVNDNAPNFVLSSYSAEVSSAVTPGHTALIVLATDPDTGSGGVIRYSLQSKTRSDLNYFYVNVYAGLIQTKGPLLLMGDHTFHLTVTATDSGTPPKQSSVNVTIHVSLPPTPPLIVINPVG